MLELRVVEDLDDMGELASAVVEQAALASAVADRPFRFAVSGGRTPRTMFTRLAERTSFPWENTIFYQVDERIAPVTDADRNLTLLRETLPTKAAIEAMPVEDPDLEGACQAYARCLPDGFDLVHLGLGEDGHVASLVPGDGVLQVTDRLVALTERPYQARRRMTLTYPALDRANSVLWLVSGEKKRTALARLLARDPDIPATRVHGEDALVIADRAAVGR